jgi:hypothetical protein
LSCAAHCGCVPSQRRSRLRVLEVTLAVATLFVTAMELTAIPQPYPTWPEAFGVPVNPSLVVPGLLAVAVLAGVVLHGIGLSSLLLVGLALPTVFIAQTSKHANLTVPCLLVVAVVAGVVLDGVDLSSLLLVGLALPTVFIALLSIHTLMIGASGVFWGGFFTMILAVPLSVATLIRVALGGPLDALPELALESGAKR